MTTGHTYGEALRVLKDGLQISRAADPPKLIAYQAQADGRRVIVTHPTDGRASENWNPSDDELKASDWRIHE